MRIRNVLVIVWSLQLTGWGICLATMMNNFENESMERKYINWCLFWSFLVHDSVVTYCTGVHRTCPPSLLMHSRSRRWTDLHTLEHKYGGECNEFAPQGQGNTVSIEFNLMYRWHACVSEQDTQWTEAEFTKAFQGKDFSTVCLPCLCPHEHISTDEFWLL